MDADYASDVTNFSKIAARKDRMRQPIGDMEIYYSKFNHQTLFGQVRIYEFA